MSSPLTPWSDANSTFGGNSPYLDSSRAGSSTSLWTASSASSILEPGEEDDVSSELRCLELLAELEREKRRKSAEEKRVLFNQTEGGGYLQQHSRDDSLPDVVQPLNLGKARAARIAKQASESQSQSSTLRRSPTTQRTQRVSRRASFTTTDLAELDIDAILDAYASDALAMPQYDEDGHYPLQQALPRSKNSYNLQHQINSPPPRSALPSPPPSSLRRDSTAYSIRSTRSTRSNGSTATKNDRRPSGPFPVITRQRSNGSLASRKLPFDATAAPPLPSPPHPMPTSVPMSNRTFSSFSRESNASTSSSHSLPLRSLPMSPRVSCASSTMSRQTSSASTNGSFRWSVATSSTVPTLVSDGSSDCGASRRGSIAPSSVGSFRQSPNRSRRRPSAPFPGSPIEQEEDEDRFWSRRGSAAEQGEEEEEDSKEGGLISWEDFADELANLPVPVPNRPNPPRRMNSQSSSHSSKTRSRNNVSRSPFPSSSNSSPTAIYASPESLRSTATLTSLNSSKPASPSPSNPNSRSVIGKKGILQGLRNKKSTRELVSVFA
ncbi:hypothetical protein JCM3765_007364 [Sporobolomyces pararoseus]